MINSVDPIKTFSSMRTFKLFTEFCDKDFKFCININPLQPQDDLQWLREYVDLGLINIKKFNSQEFTVLGKLTRLGQKLQEELDVE